MTYESSVLNTRYRLDRKVGQGGFAQVFLATDLLLKRRVAIKVLNADLTADPDFLARFEREAQAIAALDHPNILAVYDYGQAHDTAYLVMPYVEGGTLYDRLRQQRALGLPETGEYLRQAAAALDYAHRRGIVHRDIKPQNMLIRAEDGRLLLADFGIAKVLSSTTTSQTRTGVMGTIAYMAPEQFQGQVGRATDVYALGCVLFQCVTGQVPYTGLTEQVIYGHVMGPVPSLVERPQGRPAGGYHQAPTGAPATPTAARRGPSRALLGGIGGVLAVLLLAAIGAGVLAATRRQGRQVPTATAAIGAATAAAPADTAVAAV